MSVLFEVKTLLRTPGSWPARWFRFVHQLARLSMPWKWKTHPPCQAVTDYASGPDTKFKLKCTRVTCTCGRDFSGAK